MIIKKETKHSGVSADCGRAIVGRNSKALVVENGLHSTENSGGPLQETLRLYKRRCINKNSTQAKILENGSVSVDTFRQHPHKKMNVSKKTSLNNYSHGMHSGSSDSRLNNSRNTVLGQLYESIPGSDGGLLGRSKNKVSVRNCVYMEKSPSLPDGITSKKHVSDKGPMSLSCNGSSSKSSLSNSDLCRHAFLDVVKSEKFTQLCDLLVTNFEGAKYDSILDIRPINSRMKEGVYEKSPMLFHSDIQEVWEHLGKVGSEIVSLSKCLMDNSKALLSKKFSGTDFRVKLEQTENCGLPKVCTCRRCGERAEGKESLVCDSCEEMFHIYCIEPALEEIPTDNWYCINCLANDVESRHDNCVVCERLNATVRPNNGLSDKEIEIPEGDNTCNICKTDVLNGKKIKVCGHSLCPHRYYHMNCLTFKQLSTYGPCWYCPSCLCRACLTDRDDHAIVLCDGCDLAYHIYCVEPPLAAIPDGKWFCVKCDSAIQKIAKSKREFEKKQSNPEKKAEDEKGVHDDEAVDDMLLSVAITENCSEDITEAEIKS